MDVRNRIARRASARAMRTSVTARPRRNATDDVARALTRARDAARDPTRVVVDDDDAAAPECDGTRLFDDS
jgi:hypothetical protein